MTIDELIAEELTKDPKQDAAAEPLRVYVDDEGDFLIVARPAKSADPQARLN